MGVVIVARLIRKVNVHMNCFAHAICFLDQGWFAIGTGLPDWLGMADRSVRLRPKHIDPVIESGEPDDVALCRGIEQHWHDDDWFHVTPAFHDVSAKIGKLFRASFDAGDNFRSGFLGHIAMELLVDGVLTEKNPGLLDRYYELVDSIDGKQLQDKVNSLGARQTEALVPFLDRYRSEQFMRDYVDDAKLLYRLNRVLVRVRLPELPDGAVRVITESRKLVRDELPALVSEEILAAV